MNNELELSNEANGAALVDTQVSLSLPINVSSQGPPPQSLSQCQQQQQQLQQQQPQSQQSSQQGPIGGSQPLAPLSPNSSAKKANKKRKLDELSLENISDSECPSKPKKIPKNISSLSFCFVLFSRKLYCDP